MSKPLDDSKVGPKQLNHYCSLTNTLNEALTQSGIRPAGFCGVMFSLLEDAGLGTHNNFKAFSIDSLLSYCSVCGCGLDIIPIPGDTFEEEISSLILDVATMSTILKKPLGVRLPPIPLKHANEFTSFECGFLTNTRIKDVKNRVCKWRSLTTKSSAIQRVRA